MRKIIKRKSILVAFILLSFGGMALAQGAPEIEWEKTFDRNPWDYGKSVQQTTDGGYIIAGSSDGSAYLIKTDTYGDKEWDKFFSGVGGAQSVQQITDGGYIIVGTADFDACLIKTDTLGSEIWNKTFDTGRPDMAHFVQQTNDGGYIIAGATYYGSYGQVYLIKTDANGGKEWDKIFGRGGGYSVQQTSDGGYIIAGVSHLIKTDANGEKEWDKTFDRGSGWSVQQTTDGGYISAGHRWFYGANHCDIYLVKLKPANQPPVANANGPYESGTRQILLDVDPDTLNIQSQGRWVTAYLWAKPEGTAKVTLDGLASYDPDDDSLTYHWTITDSEGNIIEASGVDPVVTLGIGNYTLTLVVNDGLLDSEPDETAITISPINLATIEPTSLYLNGVQGEWGEFQDPELMVKFDWWLVADTLEIGDEVEVVISGEDIAETSDVIRVIDRGRRKDKGREKRGF